MTTNNITGDKLITKPIKEKSAHEKYSDNWDKIFSNRQLTKQPTEQLPEQDTQQDTQ